VNKTIQKEKLNSNIALQLISIQLECLNSRSKLWYLT